MQYLIATLGAILAFFIVVVVHEYGHFLVARAVGVKILRFSVGFGKPIFKHRAKNGVEFVIGMLPFGGYVKMQDAFSEAENLPGSRGEAFESKPVWARMAVVLAGPIANLLLAWFVFTLLFSIGVTQMKPIVGHVTSHSIADIAGLQSGDQLIQMGRMKTDDWRHVVMFLMTHIGDARSQPIVVLPNNTKTMAMRTLNLQQWRLDSLKPDLLGSLGITPYFPKIPPVIDKIMPNTPAAKSGFQHNDAIVEANHQPISSWQTFVSWIEKHPNQSVIISVRRDKKIVTLSAYVGEKNGMGFLGIQPKPIHIPPYLQVTQKYPWYQAGGPALHEMTDWVVFHLIVIKQMVLGRISLKTLGGPVAIFQTAGDASLAGFTSFLQFIAFISVVLGILNVLPIPALDGGHFLFFAIEAITGRPLSSRVQILLTNLGIVCLLMMMVYATVNDITRLLQ